MAIYVKVNEVLYPAEITGRIHDKDWDDRSSKAITLEMTYESVIKTFIDDVEWSIVQDVERQVEKEVEKEVEKQVEKLDEEGNKFYETVNETVVETIIETITEQETYDNSEYSIAGDVVDHRNGKVTVKMGKPTADELLALFMGGETV